jgi:hypothetical protein
MRDIRAYIVLAIAAAFTTGCKGFVHPARPTMTVIGSGRLVSETWPVGGFSAVSISDAGHLVIEHTGHESLQVTAEDNILPLLQAEVRAGRLVIGARPGTRIKKTCEIRYRLTVRELSDIEASGASLVEVFDVNTERLQLVLSGASIAEVAGIAGSQLLEISGASLLLARGLQSREVVVSVSGASYAGLRVKDLLSGSVSGASTVEYVGDPLLSLSVSSSSVVRRMGS